MNGINRLNKTKILLISTQLVLVCTLVVDSFIRNIVSKNFLAAVLGILFLIIVTYLKWIPDNKQNLYDAMLTVIIISFAYYIAIYLFGLITGFYLNNILSLFGILKNLLQSAFFIVAMELFRYIVINTEKKSKTIFIMLVVVLTLCDVSDNIYACNLTDISDVVYLIGYYVFPSAIKNIALNYIALKVSYKPAILYRFVLELPVYFLPIIPNTGEYLQIIFSIALPLILFAYSYTSYGHFKVRYLKIKRAWIKKSISFFIITILTIFVALVSGFFKYKLVIVGSGSMSPIIEKGDGIIVKKLSDKEISDLEIGDILVFNNSGMTMVHRITKISNSSKGPMFTTKGDANASEDADKTSKDNIVGVASVRIPIIGVPTVWLRGLKNF